MKKNDFILGFVVTLIWGANFSVIKLGLNSLDPFLLTALRFTLCAFPLAFFVKRPQVSLTALISYGLIFGVGLWGLVNLGIYKGISAGLSSLVLQFSAFFTILLGAVFFKERISGLQYLAMLIALSGLFTIFYTTTGSASTIGILLVLAGAVSWSACNMIVKKSKPEDMFSFIVWSSMFSAVPLFIITYIVKGSAPFINIVQSLNGIAIFSILFQSYVTTIFGYWVWNSLLKKYPASMVAPLSLFVPVSGVLTSWLVFQDEISGLKWLACLLILLGITLFVFAKKITSRL